MKRTVVAIFAGLVALVSDAGAATYRLDKGHTVVAFTWQHLGMTRQEGRFSDVEGTLTFEVSEPEASSLEVKIGAGSINTGFPERDRHLRTSDFFDAANHRHLEFKSTSVKKTSDKTGEVTGNLTIRGVSKPVTLAVTWTYLGEHPLGKFNALYLGKQVAAFSAKTTIKRSEWGLNRVLPLVGDDIEIRIETEMIRAE
jgi:polyisoprenoid-binding protein YceI